MNPMSSSSNYLTLFCYACALHLSFLVASTDLLQNVALYDEPALNYHERFAHVGQGTNSHSAFSSYVQILTSKRGGCEGRLGERGEEASNLRSPGIIEHSLEKRKQYRL